MDTTYEDKLRNHYVANLLSFFKLQIRDEITDHHHFGTTLSRESTIIDICHAAQRVQQQTNNGPLELLCLFNGTGAGKLIVTWQAKDLVPEYLKKNPDKFPSLKMEHCFRIWIRQSTGYWNFARTLNELNMFANMGLYVRWCIASQLLTSTSTTTCQVKFRSLEIMLRESKLQLKALSHRCIIQAFKELHNLNQAKDVWIFFLHHDVQKLTWGQHLMNSKDKPMKKSALIHQYIMEVLQFSSVAKKEGINVLNFFCGTYPLDQVNIFASHNFIWKLLTLEPLKGEDGIALLSAKHPTLAAEFHSPLFKQAFLLLGNIPQLWVEFSKSTMHHFFGGTAPNWSSAVKDDIHNILREVQAHSRNSYHYSQKDVSGRLLHLLAVQGWTWAEAKAILPTLHACNVDELQNNGLLYFDVHQKYFVPPIYLQCLSTDADSLFARHFYGEPGVNLLSGQLTTVEFGKLCLEYFVMKQRLMDSIGLKKVPVEQYFKGAWIHKESMEQSIDLGQYHKSVACWYHWLGSKDPHQDAFIHLESDTLIQFKVKYISGQQTKAATAHSLLDFAEAQEMAEKSTRRINNVVHYFVYITNGYMPIDSDQVQHANSIIICANNFDEVFGPTFAPFFKHIIDTEVKHLDANQSTIKETNSNDVAEEGPAVAMSKEESSEVPVTRTRAPRAAKVKALTLMRSNAVGNQRKRCRDALEDDQGHVSQEHKTKKKK